MLREPPGRAPLLDAEQERALVAACDSQRLRMLALLGIETGCRLSKLTGLRWRDLDLSAGILRVERSKSGKRRDLPLSAVALDLLRTWRPDGVPAGRYVLPTRSGRRWLAAQRPWERATNAAGLAGWRLHDLRHVFASRAVMRGVDLPTVAACLGHSGLQMVQRYSHLTPGHRAAAVRGVAPSLAPSATEQKGGASETG
jgi:integrase